MAEREPRRIRDVRDVLRQIPNSRWLRSDGLSEQAVHGSVDQPENSRGLAGIVYPVYAYLLQQKMGTVWTREKVYQESLEIGLYNYDPKVGSFSSAILLLVNKLRNEGVIEQVGSGDCVRSDDSGFRFKDSFLARGKAHEIGAELAQMGGLGDEVINSHRDDALYFRRRGEAKSDFRGL